jgi:hypothetical protein
MHAECVSNCRFDMRRFCPPFWRSLLSEDFRAAGCDFIAHVVVQDKGSTMAAKKAP